MHWRNFHTNPSQCNYACQSASDHSNKSKVKLTNTLKKALKIEIIGQMFHISIRNMWPYSFSTIAGQRRIKKVQTTLLEEALLQSALEHHKPDCYVADMLRDNILLIA